MMKTGTSETRYHVCLVKYLMNENVDVKLSYVTHSRVVITT